MIPLQPGNCRPLAHNRLVGGSSPLSPTNHSPHCRDFLGRRQITRIGAFRRVDLVSGFLALGLHGRYGRSVSVPQNHFSWETETGLTRDWFESGRLLGCACRRGALTGFYCRGRCGCRRFRASVLRRSQGVRRFWRHWHGNDEQTRQIGYRRPEGRGLRHA